MQGQNKKPRADSGKKKVPWSQEEDESLVVCVARFGDRVQTYQHLLPGRTIRAIQDRIKNMRQGNKTSRSWISTSDGRLRRVDTLLAGVPLTPPQPAFTPAPVSLAQTERVGGTAAEVGDDDDEGDTDQPCDSEEGDEESDARFNAYPDPQKQILKDLAKVASRYTFMDDAYVVSTFEDILLVFVESASRTYEYEVRASTALKLKS